jgi:hypothetical protein
VNVKLLFGKPLPPSLRRAKAATNLSWAATLILFAGAGLATWLVMSLLMKDAREAEEMIYFWPE